MDGVDVALIRTDGQSQVASVAHEHVPYAADFVLRLKKLERVCARCEGDWSEVLGQLPTAEAIVAESTDYHARAIAQLLLHNDCQPEMIGYHGQTLYHQPARGRTLQVGDAGSLARQFSCPVVADFRRRDVQAGGQGAPLVPLYHQALVRSQGLSSALVINCGGIANTTWVAGDQLAAADIGPGCVLLDRWVREKTAGEYTYDHAGQWARQGKCYQPWWQWLCQHALGQPLAQFSSQSWPGSLDSYDIQLPPATTWPSVSLADGCYTLAAFTAYCMVQSLLQQGVADALPEFVILAGGGWQHPVIRQQFVKAWRQLGGQRVVDSEYFSWSSQAIEAEAFAYLAVRHAQGLPTSLPETTGVPTACVGGVLFDATNEK